MPTLTIGDRTIGDDADAYVIAELAQNHGGNLYTALQMMRAATDAGCDAVKRPWL